MHRIYTHTAKSDIERYQTVMTDFYKSKLGRKNVSKEKYPLKLHSSWPFSGRLETHRRYQKDRRLLSAVFFALPVFMRNRSR